MDKFKATKIALTTADATAWTLGGVFRLLLRIFVTAVMVFVITGLLFACIFAYYVKTELNPKLKFTLEDASLSLSSTIWYTGSDGMDHELQTVVTNENRIWVDYAEIPQHMKDAQVTIEDKRFFDHNGVDWTRTLSAVGALVGGRDSYGGSTITQQLIKNITDDN